MGSMVYLGDLLLGEIRKRGGKANNYPLISGWQRIGEVTLRGRRGTMVVRTNEYAWLIDYIAGECGVWRGRNWRTPGHPRVRHL